MKELKFRMFYEGKMHYRNLTDRNWYYTERNDDNGCHTAFLAMPGNRVNPIMQCTGLRDKSGKEVFEGDIIDLSDREGNPGYYRVEFNNKRASFCCTNVINGHVINLAQSLGTVKYKTPAIIGNVHENPELLEDLKC